jgi:hypothetical protein
MNFQDLLKKMADIDQPVQEGGCGMPAPGPIVAPTPDVARAPETPPPSMSVNLNAQGMDNIEQMMKLFQKVNPDMMPRNDVPMPSMSNPIIKIGAVKKPEPMKMLAKPEESWENEPDEDVKGMDAVIRNGDDLNKPKKTFPKVAGGDNPMQRMESQDELIKSIEAQLRLQLEEMKGNR